MSEVSIKWTEVYVINSDSTPKSLYAGLYSDKDVLLIVRLNSDSRPLKTSAESVTQVLPLGRAKVHPELERKVKESDNFGRYVSLSDYIEISETL